MSADIVDFPWISNADLDPDRVLESCKGQLKHVLILGLTEEGVEFSQVNYADGPRTLWLLEWAKKRLLDHAEELRQEVN